MRKRYAIWCVSGTRRTRSASSSRIVGAVLEFEPSRERKEGWLPEKNGKIRTFESRQIAEEYMDYRKRRIRENHDIDGINDDCQLYVKEFPDQFAIWCVNEGGFGNPRPYWLTEHGHVKTFSSIEEAQAEIDENERIQGRADSGFAGLVGMMAGHTSYHIKTYPDGAMFQIVGNRSLRGTLRDD
jgi:hypothetical protein